MSEEQFRVSESNLFALEKITCTAEPKIANSATNENEKSLAHSRKIIIAQFEQHRQRETNQEHHATHIARTMKMQTPSKKKHLRKFFLIFLFCLED